MVYHAPWNKLHSTCIDLGLLTEVFWQIKSEKGELHWLASNSGCMWLPTGLVRVDFVVIDMDQAFLMKDFAFLVIPKSFRSCFFPIKEGLFIKEHMQCRGVELAILYTKTQSFTETERPGWRTTHRIHLAQIAIELRVKIFCGLKSQLSSTMQHFLFSFVCGMKSNICIFQHSN